jgi:uncharacterized membrane protein
MSWLFDLLDQILCWVKQIGAMVLSAIIDAVNLILAGLGLLVNGLIAAWPISMPALPTIPSTLLTTFGWVKWTPLPVNAAFGLLGFLVGVELVWQLGAVLLRWLKVTDQ